MPRALTVSQTYVLGTQVVRVSWSGFTPTRRTGQYAVNVVQCIAGATSIDRDCFNAVPFPNSENGNGVIGATTRADGTGSVDLEVRDGSSLPTLGCTAAKPCSIVAYELTAVRASGEIKPDGSFTLETLQNGGIVKGARSGTFRARVILPDDDPKAKKAAAQAVNKKFLSFDSSGLSFKSPPDGTVTLRLSRP